MHGRARKDQLLHIQTSMWTSQEMWGQCLCVLRLFLYALMSVFILKGLLYCWKRLDSRKNTLISLSAMLEFPNYVFHTPKSSLKSFPANLLGPQNWLWCLWTHSPEGHEFKSQVGDGGGCCHGSLIFSCRPFPHFFSASHAAVTNAYMRPCYFCLLI